MLKQITNLIMVGIRKKFSNNSSVYLAVIFLLTMLIIGVVGYSILENYNPLDALFMTIITISTVGFREVQPLSYGGKIFTILLVVFSFGIFAYALTTITRFLIDGVLHNYFKLNKVRRRIENAKDHVIICGYGRNGRQAAIEAKQHGFEVLIIEQEESIIKEFLNDAKIMFVKGDATRDEILFLAKVDCARALITTLPNDADNLFVVLSVRDLNPGLKIISRASDDNSDKKLRRAGATNIIMSDKLGGQRMAKLIAQPDVVEFLDHILIQQKNSVSLEEISFSDLDCEFTNKTIRELGVRDISGVNIIGLRNKKGEYLLNPSPDLEICCEDKLFVLGTEEQIGKLSGLLRDMKQ